MSRRALTCAMRTKVTRLHFFCEKRPRGVQTDFPPGRYKITIRARSDEGTTCSQRFLVAYDGSFRNLYMEQLEG